MTSLVCTRAEEAQEARVTPQCAQNDAQIQAQMRSTCAYTLKVSFRKNPTNVIPA